MAVFTCIAIRILYNPVTKKIRLVDYDKPNVPMNVASVPPGVSVVWELNEDRHPQPLPDPPDYLDSSYSVQIDFQPRRGFERVFSPFPVQKLSFIRTSMAMPAMFLETRYKYSVTVLRRGRVQAVLDPEIEPTGTGGYGLALLRASSPDLIAYDPNLVAAPRLDYTIIVTRTGDSYYFQQQPTGSIPRNSWVSWAGVKDGNPADVAIVFPSQTPFVDGYGNPIHTIYSTDGAYQIYPAAPGGAYPYTAQTIDANGDLEPPPSGLQDLMVSAS